MAYNQERNSDSQKELQIGIEDKNNVCVCVCKGGGLRGTSVGLISNLI